MVLTGFHCTSLPWCLHVRRSSRHTTCLSRNASAEKTMCATYITGSLINDDVRWRQRPGITHSEKKMSILPSNFVTIWICSVRQSFWKHAQIKCNASDQFQKETRNCRRGLRSRWYAELGHFTLLFCRGRLRNVQRLITYMHGHCCAH